MVSLLKELAHFLGLFRSKRLFESVCEDCVVPERIDPFVEDVRLSATAHLQELNVSSTNRVMPAD